ncbi:MAG: MgtC/SapB family protein, partial [Vicinamibacterales bacterium]
VALLVCVSGEPLRAQPPDPSAAEVNGAPTNLHEEIVAAAIRLPLAALLGTVLALRPRRRGTPDRQMSVVETQIILAVVGALVMLVVGASLARAFGIVGAANLIRYRAKVDDPKDAVVMLSALGVGLASGVGLYGLAILGTLFIGAALWTIEGFEPAANKRFDLTIQIKDGVGELRPKIEGILRRFHAGHEIRASSADGLSYAINAPPELRVDRVSNAITELAPPDQIAVEWQQKTSKKEA